MRQKNKSHCDFIRSLPCLICQDNTATECAHIRMADPRIAKPITGIGIRPDDRFTTPLCHRHHHQQHLLNEKEWWDDCGIDPVLIALALYSVSGDYNAGIEIIEANR